MSPGNGTAAERVLMKTSPIWSRERRGTAAFGIALVVFTVAVLWPALELAGRLDDTTAALRLVSEQRRQADVVAGALASVRDRLESFGYIDEPLAEIRASVGELDGLVQTLTASAASADAFASNPARAIRRSPALRADVAELSTAWGAYRHALVPIAAFGGVPYADSESAGVRLNDGGRLLALETRKAIAAVRKQGPPLIALLGRVATALEGESTRLSGYLRLLMLAALGGALALGAGLAYVAFARRRATQLLAAAERQTGDILKTVREGLFLLDARGRIGAVHSASMQRLFKRDVVAGLRLEELLQPLVPEKTLQTALRFVEVLWSERTKENLVKSINPLQEVEVSFETESGQESRWLEFDFHRVRHDGKLVNLLVAVHDVTHRVRLAGEIAELRERAQSQVDTLLGVLSVNPRQLRSFLGDSDAGLRMVNARLREPAHDDAALRQKVDAIFRQIHSIKGEAAALGLTSVQGRAHDFESQLKELRDAPVLSGGDFLPLTLKLDDLFTHLASISDLVARLGQLQPAAAAATVSPATRSGAGPAASVSSAPGARPPDDDLTGTLRQLLERIAADRGKSAQLVASGLDGVPDVYRRAVKDIAVQALRNSLVHGLEGPAARAGSGKPGVGTVKIDFRDEGDSGFRLVVEDDGAGLNLRKIREAAVDRGILSTNEAIRIDSKQLLPLLFRAGFSTEQVADGDSGRGVGMNLVAELVRELRGRVSLSSGEGRYTRLTIVLPAAAAPAALAG